MKPPDKNMEKVFLNFEGPFSIQIISTFAKFLLENTIATEHARRKLYKVFIELAQNVAIYSADRVQLPNGSFVGKGIIHVAENLNDFKCLTINKIHKEHAAVLIDNCVQINSATIKTLKTKKKNLRKIANYQDTGAHIGLIMICMYSENPIDYEIIDEKNGDVYFKIAATINKNGHFQKGT